MGIGDEGAKAVALLIRYAVPVFAIQLAHNGITDKGALALIEALSEASAAEPGSPPPPRFFTRILGLERGAQPPSPFCPPS